MVGWELMPPKASGVSQCHQCIVKTIKPLEDFTRRRKTKTLRSVGLTMVNVFDQLQMKMLYLNTPFRPIVEIFTIAMKGGQLSVDFDAFLFVSPLLP